MESETTTVGEQSTEAATEPGPETAAEHPADALPDDLPAVEEPPTAPTPDTGSSTTETPKDEQRQAITEAPAVEQKPEPAEAHLHKIEAAERMVGLAEERYEGAKSVAKLRKEEYEMAVSDLREIIRAVTEPAPLFDQMNAAAEPGLKPGELALIGVTSEEDEAVDPDAWKSIPISELIPGEPRIAELLAEKYITNFGQLEEWRAKPFEKIKGLGDMKRQAIDDAVMNYWVKNPRPVAAAAANAGELVWELEDGIYFAGNTLDIQSPYIEGTRLALFEIDSTVTPLRANHDPELVPDGWQSPEYTSIGEAKAWCEARMAELKAEQIGKPSAAEVDAGHPFIGASGKNWALKISTHQRSDGTHATAWDIRVGEITNESPIEGNHPSRYAAQVWAIAAVRAFLAGSREDKLGAAGLKAARAVETQLDKAIRKLQDEAAEQAA